MNVLLAWVLIGLGLIVVAAPRRSMAVTAVTAQAMALLWPAARDAHDTHELCAASALALRTLVLAALFLLLIRRSPNSHVVRADISVLSAVGLAIAFALGLIWLIPPIGLSTPTVERTVLALVAFGLVTAATSKATVTQIVGAVVMENAMVLAASRIPGTSWLIELGLACDVILLAVVAGVFHRRIVAEFGVGDTRVLRSLRD